MGTRIPAGPPLSRPTMILRVLDAKNKEYQFRVHGSTRVSSMLERLEGWLGRGVLLHKDRVLSSNKCCEFYSLKDQDELHYLPWEVLHDRRQLLLEVSCHGKLHQYLTRFDEPLEPLLKAACEENGISFSDSGSIFLHHGKILLDLGKSPAQLGVLDVSKSLRIHIVTPQEDAAPYSGLCLPPERKNLADLFNNELLSDVVLEASDGTSFRCHRLVLGLASTPLKNLVAGGMLESFTPTIVLPNVDGPTLEAFLKSLYGCAHFLPDAAALQRLSCLADQYDVAALQRRCADMMRQYCGTGVGNCVGLYRSTAAQGLGALAEVCWDVLLAHHLDQVFVFWEQFAQFSLDEVERLCAEAAQRDVCAYNVFLSLMAWLRRDWAERGGLLEHVLRLVPFHRMDAADNLQVMVDPTALKCPQLKAIMQDRRTPDRKLPAAPEAAPDTHATDQNAQ